MLITLVFVRKWVYFFRSLNICLHGKLGCKRLMDESLLAEIRSAVCLHLKPIEVFCLT